MGDRAISQANLNFIENNLQRLNENLHVVNDNVLNVTGRVDNIQETLNMTREELDSLRQLVDAFVTYQHRQNILGQAKTEIVRVHQELKNKYGHYDVVRRSTLGILQANDLGLVRKSSVENASDEVMLQTPGYWLAPCLVALSAWINDNQPLAEKAVKEALRRDEVKTSLFFLLINRRINRKQAAYLWTERYLLTQSARKINRKTIVVLDAFSNGLLGVDSEQIVATHLQKWIDELSTKGKFIAKQRKKWINKIYEFSGDVKDEEYPYLSAYAPYWQELVYSMNCVRIHSTFYTYLQNIFNRKISYQSLLKDLEAVLEDLVHNYDEEELPLRKKDQFLSLVIEYEGDDEKAKQIMAEKEDFFVEEKPFTDILVDAAMDVNLEQTLPSTQKLAVALSKNWIIEAYQDIIGNYRMGVSDTINFTIESFEGYTKEGENETEMIQNYISHMNQEEQSVLVDLKLGDFAENGNTYATIALVIAIILWITSHGFIATLVAGFGAYSYINRKQEQTIIEDQRNAIKNTYNDKRNNGTLVIQNIMAEVVDYRQEFEERDEEAKTVLDFLHAITPNQYITARPDEKKVVY